MLRNMTEEGPVSSGQSSSPRAGRGVASGGLVPQESPWLGLFSVVSRPARCLVQRLLPPRAQLDHVMPVTQHAAAHLTDTWCQQARGSGGGPGPGPGSGGGAGPGSGGGPGSGSAPPWLTAASLRDLGIEDPGELSLGPPTRAGGVSSVRTFLNPVLMNPVLMNPVSAQEVKPRGGADWMRGSKGGTWWGSLWGGEDTSQRALSWTEDQTQTPPPPAESTRACVQRGGEDSTVREPSGAAEHKEEQLDSEGLHTVQNPQGSTPELSSPGGGACSEPLTPDQDHGYSSLEEEHFLLKNSSEETRAAGTCETTMQDQRSEGTSETTMQNQRSEGTSETTSEDRRGHSADEGQAADKMAPAPPECRNKAIAFIMGCPCSDEEEDSSQSESSEEEEDDDGFDSEGSSGLSDSTDEDEDDEDSEGDSESERLWNALCQSVDPYNPRSFSAQLHSTPPRTVPTATPPTATPPPPPSSSSSSPPSGLDVWDDSTSASEADEVESLRLLSSFSCTSDPYSPLNFQAPIRTTGTHKVAPEAPPTPPHSAHRKAASPPEYRKDEAEERLDSGFSEPPAPPSSSSSQSAASTKKVRFCERVEEIFLGGGEDRRGPWEQMARDRGRFLRRCQEAEQSIGFCLQPQHRRLVVLRGQGTPPIQEEDAPERISN